MPLGVVALLRALHLVASAFWLGVMLINGAFLLPSIRAAGPAGGAVMAQIVRVRRLPLYVNAAVAVSLITGVVLYAWRTGFQREAMAGRAAVIVGVGGLLGILAALLGQFVNAPTARRMGRVAAEAGSGPPSDATLAEIRQLQDRLLRATWVAALLLLAAATTMAVAGYI